jgi:hypothetical protein
MIDMASYTAHGLQIDSEVSLPGLLPGSSQHPDVRIRYGSVPTDLSDPLVKGGWFQVLPDTLLLLVNNVARFLVVKGKDILIEPYPNCQDDVLRLYLLGSAFGALLIQRGILAMHASAIKTARGAVLFVGKAGHGKSTLMAAMVQRGYAMLTDDVTAISLESPTEPVAYSSFPLLRLCADAAVRLNHSLETLALVRAWDAEKYVVPVANFCADPAPVHAIYNLKVHAAPTITIEPVNAKERFSIVAVNTYRYTFLDGLGQRETHFRATTQLAKAAEIFSLTRPASPYLLDELVDRLGIEFGEPVDMAKEQEVS